MNPDSQTLNLRDIHLPSSIAWWPPAPGWWIVLAVIVSLSVLGIFLYRRKQRRKMFVAATQEFENIQHHYTDNQNVQLLAKALSIWLRRVCLSFYPRADVAALTGTAWLEFLDSGLPLGITDHKFHHGVGQVLITAPYQANVDIDADELLLLCQSWLKGLAKRSGRYADD